MVITRQIVAEKLIDYLKHRLSISQLVDWAEKVMMDAEFESLHFKEIREVISRVGLSDVKAFGLTWEECELSLKKLGYSIQIDIAKVA